MWVLLAPPNSLVSAPQNLGVNTPKPWYQHPHSHASIPPTGAGADGTAAVTGPAQQPVVPAPIATPGSINERDDEGWAPSKDPLEAGRGQDVGKRLDPSRIHPGNGEMAPALLGPLLMAGSNTDRRGEPWHRPVMRFVPKINIISMKWWVYLAE